MIVLGIDPGIVVTGFGVVDLGPRRKYRVVEFGVIRPKTKAPLEARLLTIFRGLTDVIAKHSPERVAVEGIYHSRNVSSALTLGHARGAALLAAANAGLPLAAFSPSTVKAHVSGYGLADKQQVSWMVSRLLGLPKDLLPGDASDALALAICGADLMPDAEGCERPMIGFLRGVLIKKSPQEILLDVGGVGYRVLVPISTFCRLDEQGAQAQMHIHTHVREDQLVLYGFATPMELEIFEKLISVSGVGPKVALGVLSGIEVDDLVHAVRGNDVARLTRVPGVGKKTAERLILELKDKFHALQPESAAPQPPSPKRADLLSALANLGYSAAEADRAATDVLRLQPEASLGDLLRDALRVISRR